MSRGGGATLGRPPQPIIQPATSMIRAPAARGALMTKAYTQMTGGSWIYIGWFVQGTFETFVAARKAYAARTGKNQGLWLLTAGLGGNGRRAAAGRDTSTSESVASTRRCRPALVGDVGDRSVGPAGRETRTAGCQRQAKDAGRLQVLALLRIRARGIEGRDEKRAVS